MRNACRGKRDSALPRQRSVTATEERRGDKRRREERGLVRKRSLLRVCACFLSVDRGAR